MVKAASGAGGKIQFTSERGAFPVRTATGLYFRSDRRVLVIDVQTEPELKPGPIRELFEVSYDRGSVPLCNWGVTRDGATFAFVSGNSGRDWRQVDVDVDWASTLSKVAPSGGTASKP